MADSLSPEQTAALAELQRRRSSLNSQQQAALDELIRRSRTTAPAASGPLDNAGKFFGAAWEKVNPVESVKSLYGMATDPVGTAKGIWQGHANLAGEAAEAYGRGEYGMAAQKALGAAIPLLGPDLERSVSQIEQGNTAEGLGGLAGTLAGMLLPNAAGRIARRRIGIPGMDALSPAQRAGVNFLQNRGVRMTGATLGGGDLPWAAETLSSVSPLGAYLQPRMARMTEADLSRVAKELGHETLPQNYTPMTAGQSVMDALSNKSNRQSTLSQKHYRELSDAAKDPAYTRSVQQGLDQDGSAVMADVAIPVDTEPFRAAARDLYEHMKLSSSVQRHSSNAWSTLNELMQQPRYIPGQLAEEMLGLLKGDARNTKGLDAGRLKYLIAKFQPAVDDALQQADPQLAHAVRSGRFWRAKQAETERISQQVTGVARQPDKTAMVREPEPVNVFERLTQAGDKRTKLLTRLETATPGEMEKLGRAYVEDVLQPWRNTGESFPTQGVAQQLWNGWHDLGSEARKMLFPNPMVRQNWGEFFDGMRQIARNPNPSGTAKTGASLAQLGGAWRAAETGHPVIAVLTGLGPSAIAAMMYTPRGAALMRKGFNLPPGTGPALAWVNQVGNLVQQMKVSAEDDMPAPSRHPR